VEKIEYRVRPVTRYVVTRYEEHETVGNCGQMGEFDNERVAYEVGYALCKAEHERLGWPVADDRIQYPQPILRLDHNPSRFVGQNSGRPRCFPS
jgi:hypothetical protein